MQVCHISTYWPDHSAISNYTDALIYGMRSSRQDKHFVIAENSAKAVDNQALQCLPSWNRNEDYVNDIVRTVRSINAGIVLIQYVDDLLGKDNRLPRLLEELSAHRIPTVLNCHSVYPQHWKTGYQPGGNSTSLDRALAKHATRISVHSNLMRRDLIDRGIDPDKIVVIPHGSLLQEPLDRLESRRTLGVPERARMVLFFGFVWLGKGLDFLLDVFADVAKRVPEAFFFVGGYTRRKAIYARMYMGYLRARTWWLGIAKHTRFWGDYVPEDIAKAMYSATDLVALPYKQDYSSVSGVVHQAVGFGKLVLCSQISKFHEVGEHISSDLLVDPGDRRGWVDTMSRLLTDREWAEQMRSRVKEFAAETSWEKVGKIHLKLFDSLVTETKPA